MTLLHSVTMDVMTAGGIFVACTSSRYNDPEIASVLPGWGALFLRGRGLSANETSRHAGFGPPPDRHQARLPDLGSPSLS